MRYALADVIVTIHRPKGPARCVHYLELLKDNSDTRSYYGQFSPVCDQSQIGISLDNNQLRLSRGTICGYYSRCLTVNINDSGLSGSL